MGSNKLRGRDLSKIGFVSNELKSLAINKIQKHYKQLSKNEKLKLLKQIKERPEEYIDSEILNSITSFFIEVEDEVKREEIQLNSDRAPCKVFGASQIDKNAIDQIDLALKLPISIKGALMPDAHHGYGLPVGGVLATRESVIPYAVGVDIGCSMSLSIYDVDERFMKKYHYQLKQSILNKTFFGMGVKSDVWNEHEVLEKDAFSSISFLKKLRSKAASQLGTSGGGNHFCRVWNS